MIPHDRYPCILRTAAPSDTAALQEILRVYQQCNDFLALGPNLASMEMVCADVQHALDGGRGFYRICLLPGQETIGVIDFQIGSFSAELELLMIAAPWRGLGIGARVVAWLEEQARAAGTVTRIESGVQVNNPSAIHFWQRMGFQIVSEARDMGDGTVAYALEKRISPHQGTPGK